MTKHWTAALVFAAALVGACGQVPRAEPDRMEMRLTIPATGLETPRGGQSPGRLVLVIRDLDLSSVSGGTLAVHERPKEGRLLGTYTFVGDPSKPGPKRRVGIRVPLEGLTAGAEGTEIRLYLSCGAKAIQYGKAALEWSR